jgi:S-adenosylmethionine hydrolase
VLRQIWFASDFGPGPYPGICRGVVRRLAPEVQLHDLTHDLPPYDVRAAALWLVQALPYLPVAVHLAVVDPGVGGARRAVVVATARGDLLVGPDNGLWSLAWQAVGGAVRAWELTNPSWRLHPVSRTFHGRDVFAPAAAHLAQGAPPEEAGPEVDPARLERLALPAPEVRPGRLRAEVLLLDPFGSALLGARPADAEAAGIAVGTPVRVRLPAGQELQARRVETFSAVARGELALLEDSSGWLLLAEREGRADRIPGLGPGSELEFGPAGSGP